MSDFDDLDLRQYDEPIEDDDDETCIRCGGLGEMNGKVCDICKGSGTETPAPRP